MNENLGIISRMDNIPLQMSFKACGWHWWIRAKFQIPLRITISGLIPLEGLEAKEIDGGWPMLQRRKPFSFWAAGSDFRLSTAARLHGAAWKRIYRGGRNRFCARNSVVVGKGISSVYALICLVSYLWRVRRKTVSTYFRTGAYGRLR